MEISNRSSHNLHSNHLDRRYEGRKMAKKTTNTLTAGYHEPKFDVAEPLGPEDVSYYQSQICVLHWMIGLEHVEIITEVSLLVSQLAQLREGHLKVVFHMYAHM
jgi:hypothetical protein